MDAVHNEMVNDFQAVWQDDWQDRGQRTAYFGEVNPNHNPEMPAVLLEIAFHDTEADANALRNPAFRRLAARAIAQGIAKYFATRDGASLTLPPEPPSDVRTRQRAAGTVTVAWSAPVADAAGGDVPTGYRLYRSADGLAFDDGVEVTGTSLEVDLAANETAFFRVTSTNAGGESLPSRVVGARAAPSGTAQVLIVAGFDRLDGNMLIDDDLSDYALATVERALIARINDGSHATRFGTAVAAAGVSFDTTSATAVASGEVSLSDYAAVLWFVGEESIIDGPLDDDEQAALRSYVAAGGALLVSGSELVWALGDGHPFVSEVLHTSFVADDADSYTVVGSADELSGAQLSFDDFGAGSYDADFPDVLAPLDGDTIVVMDYEGGTGDGAATLWRDPSGDAVVMTMGFPFETIAGADTRADVMARILAAFAIEADTDPGDPDPDPRLSGGCCDTGGGGNSGSLLMLGFVAWVLTRRRGRE